MDSHPDNFANNTFYFSEQGHLPSRSFQMIGTLHNTNTVEAFKSADKQKLINDAAQQVCVCVPYFAV